MTSNCNTMTKSSVILFAAAVIVLSGRAATTINSVNKFSYAANIGWIDWRGDTNSGAVIGEFVCSGFIYGANVGWINLGDGTPTNGVRYRNLSANDFGVNHDGAGNLSGFAYGANIGWINFTNRDATGASLPGPPQVDLITGRLRGFVWSANCGWISLSNSFAFVQTDSLSSGSDSDGDGIPDAWERQHTNTLSSFTASSDVDGDGFTDVEEYLADTNPHNPNSLLRITDYSAGNGGINNMITWISRPTRLYRIQERNDLHAGSSWTDVGLGLISPAPTATTTRFFLDTAAMHRFFRIEAVRPLSL